MTKNIIQDLEKKILYHKQRYYYGKAEISDEAFDELENSLRLLDPENPVLFQVGFIAEAAEKVEHQKKMLSLEKTYTVESLEKWKGEEETLSVFKIDGSSCSLLYVDGHLVGAKTRGDGVYGENIFTKIVHIPEIPKSLSYKAPLEVRGEVYCNEKGFFELGEEMKELGLALPSSQRNIVAGLLGRKENVQLCRHLSFKAFDLINEKKFEMESEKLSFLKEMGFSIPEFHIQKTSDDILSEIQRAKDFISDGDYLIDGLVFIYQKIKLHHELGETSHHPKYKLAFKFAGETKPAIIEDIEWGVSRNGVLTPVAHIRPVELSGAKISRVTLHNYGLVKSFNLKPGDEIEIIRSGEVIPKFLGVLVPAEGNFVAPKICPSCKSDLIFQDIWLVCLNKNCPSKIKEEILNYIHRSGIEDLSDKRLEELIKLGSINKISDLYRLTQEELSRLPKIKDKLASKIMRNIQKSKNQTLLQFISAIGLEGISTAKTEKIINHGFDTLEKMINIKLESLLSIEGFAEKSATQLISSIHEKTPLIHELISLGVCIKEVGLQKAGDKLLGIKFCITGDLSMPRSEIEKLIKGQGGIMASVTKQLSYLVTNESDGFSSKFKKAKELNIPIINEEQLMKMIKE